MSYPKNSSPPEAYSWPSWPQWDENELDILSEVLSSGSWAISTDTFDPNLLQNNMFGNEFASYLGVKECVTVANGSAAIVCALQALQVGAGDEVLVPALTWPACVNAVIRCGAIPVLVDIDPKTLCIDIGVAESMITSRTVAILAVHLYGTMVNPEAIKLLSEKYNLAFVEDCSHVHGASWEQKYAGSWGHCGIFSFQQSKLMTSGEGGAVVTDSPDIANRIQQLRADGRVLRRNPTSAPSFALESVGEVLGTNYCLSEFQAGILRVQLRRLGHANSLRLEAAKRLTELLSSIQGVYSQYIDQKITPSFYAFVIRINKEEFGYNSIQHVADAIKNEINFPVDRIYQPLTNAVLYRPPKSIFPKYTIDYVSAIDPNKYYAPEAENSYNTCIALHHRILLSGPTNMKRIYEAFRKVQHHNSKSTITRSVQSD